MDKDDAIRDLMAKLMQAVESSLSTSSEVRDALADLVRNGYEARLFFVANAESAEEADDEADADGAEDADGAVGEEAEEEAGEATYVVREIGAVADAGDLRFELTKLDRDFLKSLHLRLENAQ